MNTIQLTARTGLLLALLSLGACGMAPKAPMQHMGMMPMSASATVALSGANEVPAVPGTASGSLETRLDPQSKVLTWTISYAGLTGPVTAGHFHGPALAGTNAGVALPLSGSLDSPIRGSATLTEAQLADVMAGRWYLNLHTSANPGGEIRGQLKAHH